MLELHSAPGMDMAWLKDVYGEKRHFPQYRVEWRRGIKPITVATKTRKKLLIFTKTTQGGDALWLPFTPSAINYTESGGKDVISGPFSGCLMAAYEKHGGGGRRVCHVSTSGDDKDCKELWDSIKEDCSSYVEFKPSLVYDSLSKKQMKKIGAPLLFGLITGDNRCYSIIVNRTPTNGFMGSKVVSMQPTAQG